MLPTTLYMVTLCHHSGVVKNTAVSTRVDRSEDQGNLLRVRHIMLYSTREELGVCSNKALFTHKLSTLLWQLNPLTKLVAFPLKYGLLDFDQDK